MTTSTRNPIDGRADVHLRHLVENLVRAGRSEREIEAAVRRAAPTAGPARRPRRSRLAWRSRSRS